MRCDQAVELTETMDEEDFDCEEVVTDSVKLELVGKIHADAQVYWSNFIIDLDIRMENDQTVNSKRAYDKENVIHPVR